MNREEMDAWAHHVTRLCDDEVILDEYELKLLALQREGVLTTHEALLLQAQYLRRCNYGRLAESG